VNKIKFVITDYIHTDLKWEEEQCREMGIDFEYYQLKEAPPQELLKVSADADVILINMAKFNTEVIEGLKNCKLLMRHGIGYDNIDVETCNKKGIAVAFFPDYCVKEVAEQAVMLIMACQRKLIKQVEKVQQVTDKGYPNYMDIAPIYRLHGKTVGIVGIGRIGSTVYNMLQGFGVNFLIDDPYLPEERKREMGIETVSLEKVLTESDIVTLHVPYSWPNTHHMIDEPQLKMMKPTSVIVNTARGPIINTEALNKALDDGVIGLAGIDVHEGGVPKPDSPLIHNEKAICTPHMGWLSVEAGWEIRHSYIENVKRFLNKQDSVHRVNPEVKIRFE